MDVFLQKLIAYLATFNVVPSEISSTDVDRSGSYLFDMPNSRDDPDHVVVFKNYHTTHATAVAKNIGIVYVQVLIRDISQSQAYTDIQTLYKFLLERSDIEQENGNIYYLDSTTWAIFEITQGPMKIQIDERGRHIWGLSFLVKTNFY